MIQNLNKLKIRILTLNIHKGFSFGNRKYTLEKMKSQLKASKADIVFLQEVVGAHSVFAKTSQIEFLSHELWKHHAYGKNAIYTEGHHGNAILSHFPILSQENFNISNHRYEQRGILHGTLDCFGNGINRLHVMTLHLDLTSWGRRKQLKKLVRLVEHRVIAGEPLIICGDFNDWNEEASLFLKEKLGLKEIYTEVHGAAARTYPAAFPILKLDRIYVKDLEIDSVERMNQRPWSDLSDHLPLAAVLKIPGILGKG